MGNSSSGIYESAVAGTPSVNVGRRQEGRVRARSCVIDAGETYADIKRALTNALKLRPKKGAATCYGDGNAGTRIARVLATTSLHPDRLRKRITF